MLDQSDFDNNLRNSIDIGQPRSFMFLNEPQMDIPFTRRGLQTEQQQTQSDLSIALADIENWDPQNQSEHEQHAFGGGATDIQHQILIAGNPVTSYHSTPSQGYKSVTENSMVLLPQIADLEALDLSLSKNILIVDGDFYASYALKCMMEQYQLESSAVPSGNRALDLVRSRFERDKSTFKLIFLE